MKYFCYINLGYIFYLTTMIIQYYIILTPEKIIVLQMRHTGTESSGTRGSETTQILRMLESEIALLVKITSVPYKEIADN